MAAIDQFASSGIGIDSVAANAALVVPADGTDLAYVTRGLWVGTSGNINLTMAGGQTLVWPAGNGWLPIRVTRILATNTTAQNIVAVW